MIKKLLGLVLLCAASLSAQSVVKGTATQSGVSTVTSASVASPTIVQPISGSPLAATCAQFVGAASPNTCAYQSNLTSGNFAWVSIFASGGGTLTTPTCSGTATIGTFTAVGGVGAAGSGIQQWYRALITGSGSCTVSSASTIAGNLAVLPFEVSNDGGIDGSAVYGINSCFATTGCTLTSFTPGTTGDLILSANMGVTTVTYSALTPYILICQGPGSVGNDTSFFVSSYIAPNTSAINPTYSETVTTNNMVNSAVAIK